MRYDQKQTQDFFSSLSYIEPKENHQEKKDLNFDNFLLGSLQLFRKKAQEVHKESYAMKSFHYAEVGENKRGNKNKHLFSNKNKFEPSSHPLYS